MCFIEKKHTISALWYYSVAFITTGSWEVRSTAFSSRFGTVWPPCYEDNHLLAAMIL